MIANRVELLLDMIFSDKEAAESNFDILVPKFQSELYVLYNILDGARVLNNCELSMPDVSSLTDMDCLQVTIEISKSDRAKLLKYIEDHEDALKPYRNSEALKMTIEKTTHGLSITFN